MTIIVLILLLFIVSGVAIWLFNSTVNELLNDKRYIQEFSNEIIISIPRKSFPGVISIILEYLGYLTDRDEIAPLDKKSNTKNIDGKNIRVLILSYKLTHLGIEARQKKGFNINLFTKLFFRLTTSALKLIALVFGLIAAVITLSIWVGENEELLKCITTNEKVLECVPKFFSTSE